MQPQNELHDLYLMLGPDFETLHLRRSNEADAGFEAFAAKDARRALDNGAFPDNWLFHYRFTDGQLGSLPQLAALRNSQYFRNLLPELTRAGITPTHVLPLERACLLLEKGNSVLASHERIPTSKVSDFLPSGSNNCPQLLKVRPLFHAYFVASIRQGALLFTPTIEGLRQLDSFLHYKARHFFDEQILPTFTLGLHRLPMFNPKLENHADRWTAQTAKALEEADGAACDNLFLSPDVLKAGFTCHSFDMRPSKENYEHFVHLIKPDFGQGQTYSQTHLERLEFIKNLQLSRRKQ